MRRALALAAALLALAIPAGATTLGTFGASSARAYGFGIGGAERFISAAGIQATPTTTPTNFALPAGAAAGDLFILSTQITNPGVAETTTVTVAGSGRTPTQNDCRTWIRAVVGSNVTDASCLFSIVLNAADIANGNYTVAITTSNNTQLFGAIYRGPATAITFKVFNSHSDGGQATLAFTGFAPAVNTKGVGQVSQACNTTTTPLSATNWTQQSFLHPLTSAYYLDQMVGYTNATVTFSGYDTTLHCGMAGWLYEFT